jgi:hypothetical protein
VLDTEYGRLDFEEKILFCVVLDPEYGGLDFEEKMVIPITHLCLRAVGSDLPTVAVPSWHL